MNKWVGLKESKNTVAIYLTSSHFRVSDIIFREMILLDNHALEAGNVALFSCHFEVAVNNAIENTR
jgi:hypothetical protein